MHARNKPTRLELHRLKYNQNGQRGPLLTVWDLDNSEKKIINREILQDTRVKRIDFTGDMDEQIFDEVQMGVLSEYGVMCPHPEYSLKKSSHPKAALCEVCGALVVGWSHGWRTKLRRKAGEQEK